MRGLNKFFFTCLIALILFTPILLNNVLATQEESVEHSTKSSGHGDEEHNSKSITTEHKVEATSHSSERKHVVEATSHSTEKEHGSSHKWPYYGKMVIFAKIILAFMLFSFIAPLVHFYRKGEKSH